jgi:hypothetical protein
MLLIVAKGVGMRKTLGSVTMLMVVALGNVSTASAQAPATWALA